MAPVGRGRIVSAESVVNAHEVYRQREVMRRLGWKDHAWRQARRAGLRSIRFGREQYVLGSDVLEWFARHRE